MNKLDLLDLTASLASRCANQIDSLDDESLLEVAEILIGENDEQVLKLKEFLNEKHAI